MAVAMEEEDGAGAGSAGPSAPVAVAATAAEGVATDKSTEDSAANSSWAEEMEVAAASGQSGAEAQ